MHAYRLIVSYPGRSGPPSTMNVAAETLQQAIQIAEEEKYIVHSASDEGYLLQRRT